jgi:hypothetical protein
VPGLKPDIEVCREIGGGMAAELVL